uniref:Ubiquitin carboxyl-terminal hydrolase n=1 Tax=Eptatretus burgeri TaxID=7764 RepID=A0A8C4WS98_EPTBU
MADLLLKWLSVEANPEVMTKLARQLGLVSGWEFKDVLGLDGHVLADEPISACGLLFVYPSKYEGHRLAQGSAEDPQGLLFVKYPSRGAGATLALIHTLANADVTLGRFGEAVPVIPMTLSIVLSTPLTYPSKLLSSSSHSSLLSLDPGSSLDRFLCAAKALTPSERGSLLETDKDIQAAHETCAKQGQSQPLEVGKDSDLHYIAFVSARGKLWELDGCKGAPLAHGPTSEATLVKDASHVCRDIISQQPDDIRFSAVALCKN